MLDIFCSEEDMLCFDYAVIKGIKTVIKTVIGLLIDCTRGLVL